VIEEIWLELRMNREVEREERRLLPHSISEGVSKQITSDIWMADRETGESVRESMEGRIRLRNLIEWPGKRLRECQDNGSWEQVIERNIHGRER
jgi:hypothetical protein